LLLLSLQRTTGNSTVATLLATTAAVQRQHRAGRPAVRVITPAQIQAAITWSAQARLGVEAIREL
jgi:hypothetical protein